MSISIRDVSKRFGQHQALANVSLEAPTGELTALLGPSGSGKTTLLRIIAGLETADQGEVFLHEEDAVQLGVRDRNIGFVFQHYALFRHMTVFDNIGFSLRMRKRPKAEIAERVGELMRLIQLEGMETRYPGQLSGGQRQRVALARALASRPKVLLLDEPFGALDAKVRKELRDWLRRLHDEIHVTSVFVTHDQEEALEVADRVVVMNHGKIEQVGSPEEVFHRPANPFVMQFLGQVNLFHARVEKGEVVLEDGSPKGEAQERVIGFVRPHQFHISRERNGSTSLSARIQRIFSAGYAVRLEMTVAGQDRPVEVVLSQDRFRELALQSGEEVFVQPTELKFFDLDYAI